MSTCVVYTKGSMAASVPSPSPGLIQSFYNSLQKYGDKHLHVNS